MQELVYYLLFWPSTQRGGKWQLEPWPQTVSPPASWAFRTSPSLLQNSLRPLRLRLSYQTPGLPPECWAQSGYSQWLVILGLRAEVIFWVVYLDIYLGHTPEKGQDD